MNNKALNIGLLITAIISLLIAIILGTSNFIFQLLDFMLKIN